MPTIRHRDLARISDNELIARADRDQERGEARTDGHVAYRDALEAELELRNLLHFERI